MALRPASPVAALPVSQTALVNGGPDSLLQLAGQGVLTSQPAVIAGQPLADTPALWAITDGQRRADNDFGSTNNFQSFTYTAKEQTPVDARSAERAAHPGSCCRWPPPAIRRWPCSPAPRA